MVSPCLPRRKLLALTERLALVEDVSARVQAAQQLRQLAERPDPCQQSSAVDPQRGDHQRGERGRRGNKLPRGFQKVDSIAVVVD